MLAIKFNDRLVEEGRGVCGMWERRDDRHGMQCCSDCDP